MRPPSRLHSPTLPSLHASYKVSLSYVSRQNADVSAPSSHYLCGSSSLPSMARSRSTDEYVPAFFTMSVCELSTYTKTPLDPSPIWPQLLCKSKEIIPTGRRLDLHSTRQQGARLECLVELKTQSGDKDSAIISLSQRRHE